MEWSGGRVYIPRSHPSFRCPVLSNKKISLSLSMDVQAKIVMSHAIRHDEAIAKPMRFSMDVKAGKHSLVQSNP